MCLANVNIIFWRVRRELASLRAKFQLWTVVAALWCGEGMFVLVKVLAQMGLPTGRLVQIIFKILNDNYVSVLEGLSQRLDISSKRMCRRTYKYLCTQDSKQPQLRYTRCWKKCTQLLITLLIDTKMKTETTMLQNVCIFIWFFFRF